MKKSVLVLIAGISLAAIISLSFSTSLLNIGRNNKSQNPLTQQNEVKNVKVVYTCPMHPEVIQDKPGKCPVCGMTLVKKEVPADVYTCPMHPEVIQDKPGKCPVCGMNLVKLEVLKKEEPAKNK